MTPPWHSAGQSLRQRQGPAPQESTSSDLTPMAVFRGKISTERDFPLTGASAYCSGNHKKSRLSGEEMDDDGVS
jgi:hypothetical protein